MATIAIIAVCVLVFVLQLIPGSSVTDALLYAPAYSLGQFTAVGIPYQPWRMITSLFVHSPGGSTFFFLHILFNMYTLWIFGQVLESKLGRGRFLAVYFISGLAGSLAVFGWAFVVPTSAYSAVIGASGAIFGLMAAYLVIQRAMGMDVNGMLVLVAVNLVVGFLPGAGISWQAHMGGIIGGLIVGAIVVKWRFRKRVQYSLIGGFGLMLCALALSQAPLLVG